jgi:hypothetical protein
MDNSRKTVLPMVRAHVARGVEGCGDHGQAKKIAAIIEDAVQRVAHIYSNLPNATVSLDDIDIVIAKAPPHGSDVYLFDINITIINSNYAPEPYRKAATHRLVSTPPNGQPPPPPPNRRYLGRLVWAKQSLNLELRKQSVRLDLSRKRISATPLLSMYPGRLVFGRQSSS